MDKDKLEKVLKYSLKNIQHPDTRIWNNLNYISTDINPSYNCNSPKSSEKILKEADQAYKAAQLHAKRVEDYEDFLNDCKFLLNELERVDRILEEMKNLDKDFEKSSKTLSNGICTEQGFPINAC